MKNQHFSIYSLGDSALVINFGNVIDEVLNQRALLTARLIKQAAIDGIYDIVPAYSSVTVHYDAVKIISQKNSLSAFQTLKNILENLLSKYVEVFIKKGRKIAIPVCYALKYSWDLKDVAHFANMNDKEVIQLHTGRTYKVFMIGFLPGFPYMGEVDERIAMPRKTVPRMNIGEGYVGIAGKQTGIYPLTSPGGWQIIGRTPVKLFDKTKEQPVLLEPGDEVEFFSITEHEFENY